MKNTNRKAKVQKTIIGALAMTFLFGGFLNWLFGRGDKVDNATSHCIVMPVSIK